MNRRNQEIVSDEALVAHLKRNYIYDAGRGVIVNRKLNRVVKGTINSAGYMITRLRIEGQHPAIHLHHIVWTVVHGRLPTQIDHINGDRTDNHIENLREVTPEDNRFNYVYPWKTNAQTGLPGVYIKKDCRFHINIGNSNGNLKYRDKYEAFHTLVMLGRMFSEV